MKASVSHLRREVGRATVGQTATEPGTVGVIAATAEFLFALDGLRQALELEADAAMYTLAPEHPVTRLAGEMVDSGLER